MGRIDFTKRWTGRDVNVADVEVVPERESRDMRENRRVFKADARKKAVNTALGDADTRLSYDELNGDGQYNERDFVIPSTSTRGEREKIYFGCMPIFRSIVSRIIQSRAFPYRDAGDLYRHALYRHLIWLAGLDRTLPSVMKTAQIIIDQSKETIFKAQFVQLFDILRDEIRELRDMEMEEFAFKRCREVRKQLEEIPEPMWRARYLHKFDEEFGKWVKEK